MRDHKVKKQAQKKAEKNVSSWRALRSFFSCKNDQQEVKEGKNRKNIGFSRLKCSNKDSLSVIRAEGTTAQVRRKCGSVSSCNTSSRSLKAISNEAKSASFSSNSSASITASSSSSSSSFSSSFSSLGGSTRAMHFRKSSECIECHEMVDSISGPSRDPSARANICPCPDCGEIFMKPEALELHHTERHAVSELGPEDTSRNIIEIILQSSWLKKQTPACKIDRILKVHNTLKTITMFEDCRELIMNRANKLLKKHPRCIADGNELLRFHCTTSMCSLGLNGSTNLCQSIPECKVCSIIHDGFEVDEFGKIQMMTTSGRAHEVAQSISDDEPRAMLVCRVIAGRVNKSQDYNEEYDSVAGSAGDYSDTDDLFVLKPEAILPCFIVLYRAT